MDARELEGKVALVTGASRGLGRAIARKLAVLGSKVAVNYSSSESQAEDLAREIREAGGNALAVRADVADASEVKAMIMQIKDEWGGIDILVNNAGITRDNLLARMKEEEWDNVLDVNLRGPYLCTRFALRYMMDKNWGRIINVASLAGVVGNMGQSNYSASKGGLIAFTRAIAREVAPLNITANAIAPGFIVTDMTDKLPEEAKQKILERIPVGRFGKPRDVAELAGFLASDRAGYITAQVIAVDGGVI